MVASNLSPGIGKTQCSDATWGLLQVRLQSECVRHEDLVENTTSWLRDFQARFNLRTRPGFPIEARTQSLERRRLPLPVTACCFAWRARDWLHHKYAPTL